MGVADDIARHNVETAARAAERQRHELLHVGPAKPARSCRLCRHADELARIEAQVAAGKLVQG